jgi:hypothetical protein
LNNVVVIFVVVIVAAVVVAWWKGDLFEIVFFRHFKKNICIILVSLQDNPYNLIWREANKIESGRKERKKRKNATFAKNRNENKAT